MQADRERDELSKKTLELERENKSLAGLLGSSTAEALERARTLNAELKLKVELIEKALALELAGRKTPIDAAGLSDALRVLKSEVLAYCTDRKIEPSLWKKLESL